MLPSAEKVEFGSCFSSGHSPPTLSIALYINKITEEADLYTGDNSNDSR